VKKKKKKDKDKTFALKPPSIESSLVSTLGGGDDDDVKKGDDRLVVQEQEEEGRRRRGGGGGEGSNNTSTIRDIFGSNIGEGELLFGTHWKDRLQRAEKERKEKNKKYLKLQKQREKEKSNGSNLSGKGPIKAAAGGGFEFATIEVSKARSSHITFEQFAAAFTPHAKHRDNITRRSKIGMMKNDEIDEC
jgi:hypothetical protein